MDCPKLNSLGGLPDEAMLEILARAPFRSVCRSKCVAKAWRDLIDDPLNRRRLPQTLQGFFAMTHQKDYVEHFFVKYSVSSVPLDIDPCLSFLTKLPEIERLHFLDSCNGLLLFQHSLKSNPYDVLNYIVCNPATKQWVTVPVCARCPPPKAHSQSRTYLAFDPDRAVSPHFHLIHFCSDGEIKMSFLSVHTYSSEAGVWSHSQTDWNEEGQLEGWRRRGRPNHGSCQRIFVNGILHLMVLDQGRDQIVAVDIQGRTKRIIRMPSAAQGRRGHLVPYIGQSQGRLHYMNQDLNLNADDASQKQSYELSIWVLQDYDTQEWVLKDTVSFRGLFGRTVHLDIVVIHPDCNVVFFHQFLNGLIAYDMDSKEVSVVGTLSKNFVGIIIPYVPNFSELPTLTNKN